MLRDRDRLEPRQGLRDDPGPTVKLLAGVGAEGASACNVSGFVRVLCVPSKELNAPWLLAQ